MDTKKDTKKLDSEIVSWYLAYYDYDEWHDRSVLDQIEVSNFINDFKKSPMYTTLHEIYNELLSKKTFQSECTELCSLFLKVYFVRKKNFNIRKNILVSELSFLTRHAEIPIDPYYSSVHLEELEVFINQYLNSGLYSKKLNRLLIRTLVGIENTAYFLSTQSIISQWRYNNNYAQIHKNPLLYSIVINYLSNLMSWALKLLPIIILLNLFASLFNEQLTLIQSIITGIILNKINSVINLISINTHILHNAMILLMSSVSGVRAKHTSHLEIRSRLNHASNQGAMYTPLIYQILELEKNSKNFK